MIDQIIKENTSVLLVEQDEGLKQLLVHILQEDYQVMIVKNIIEAWHYLFSGKCLPSLLIIDFDIASQNGGELINQIKANGMLKGIPIIVLCSEKQSTISTFLEVDEILFKPFDPNHLKEKIINLTA